MNTATAQALTIYARRYRQQLCNHWAHKLEVEFTAERGTIIFLRGADWPGDATVTLIAHRASLECRVEASVPSQLENLKGAVERHVDRFAFCEAPLDFQWTDDDPARERPSRNEAA